MTFITATLPQVNDIKLFYSIKHRAYFRPTAPQGIRGLGALSEPVKVLALFPLFPEGNMIYFSINFYSKEKTRMKLKRASISGAILTTAFALFCGGTAFAASGGETKPADKPAADAAKPAPKPGDVLAKVNGTSITREEVERAAAALLKQNRMGGSEAYKKQAEEAALAQLVSVELLTEEGKKLEVKDLDKKTDEKISQGKKQFPSQEDFEKALKDMNMTEKDLREITRKDIIINNLIENKVLSKLTVSPDQVKKFYDDNSDKYFKKPEQVRASHILIGVDSNATPAEKEKARQKAAELREKILKGADFAEIAKAESTCPSKAQGGDLGLFGHGQMVPPFEQAAFGLKKAGDISEVVETQFGYHIIKLTERAPASTVSFDEAKTKIADYLKNQQAQQAVQAYIEELKKGAKIEYM